MSEEKTEFEAEAAQRRQGIVGELIDFLKHNKKWWLLPIIAIFLGLGAIVLLSGTAAAPFIYTLF